MADSVFKQQKEDFISGLIKVKEKKSSRIFYMFGCPIWRIKYGTRRVRHYLFSRLPVFVHRQFNKFYLSPNFKTNNFTALSYDDEQLLARLKRMEPFTYIPNPGNMGDVLIAAGTL